MFSSAESEEIRRDFPMLSKYVFFNSAAMTPLPAPSRDAMKRALDDFSERAYFNMEEWKIVAQETRRLAAQIMGAKESETAFVRNTSEGVSIVAEGYRWKEGDEVVINDIEFPSNVYPWLNLKRRGVVVKIAKSRDGRVSPDAIAAEVGAKTRIVAISSVQFATGYAADLAALGQMAKDRGFLLFVDAIQSLGLTPMDVKSLGIDFLAAGGHKWLCATQGIGAFFCDEKRMDLIDPTRVGWHTVKNKYDFGTIDFLMDPTAARYEEGTPNLTGIYGLRESLKIVMARTIERNWAHVAALNDRMREGLESKGYKILSPWKGLAERSGIVIFSAPDKSANGPLVEKLKRDRILVMERGAGIRAATHFFNTKEDIERLINAV